MREHRCFACEGNRIVRNGGKQIHFGERFTGPEERAHGGIAVGVLACAAEQQALADGIPDPMLTYVEGRLRAPVPLHTSLSLRTEAGPDGYTMEMVDGDDVFVSGRAEISEGIFRPGDQIKSPPDHLAGHLESMVHDVGVELKGPTAREQYKAHCREVLGIEDINNCFGCSEKDIALQLFYRVTPGGDISTRWDLEPDFTDGRGVISPAIVVAALDCSNLWVINAQHDDMGLAYSQKEKKFWFTGTHGVHVMRASPPDRAYWVMARYLRQEGRKILTIAALFDDRGEVHAVAEDIAVVVDIPEDMEWPARESPNI